MIPSKPKMQVVYMDETGNKESDRYFVIGFLKVADSEELIQKLMHVRDQIEALSRYNRKRRIEKIYSDKDMDQLYNFAKNPRTFELKYQYVSEENIRFFKILTKILVNQVDFKLDALVIDRKDPSYKHTNLTDMYKIITHLYFNYRCKEECIFIPDSFDHKWDWQAILKNDNIRAVIPGSSHSLLPLQIVDILTGMIGQGLRSKEEYSNRDSVREPLLKVFTEEANLIISRSVTVSKPKYISVWTVDFSKTKRGAQSIDKKPNFGT